MPQKPDRRDKLEYVAARMPLALLPIKPHAAPPAPAAPKAKQAAKSSALGAVAAGTAGRGFWKRSVSGMRGRQYSDLLRRSGSATRKRISVR